jgi:thymidylate kinase
VSRSPLLICFTGIDGSGKTTQAKLLLDWMEARGVRATYVWSRGEMLAVRRLLLNLGRRAVGTSTQQIKSEPKAFQSYQQNKGRLKKNPAIRLLWSLLTRIEHLMQIRRDITTELNAGHVVICDRYLWDSILDLAFLHKKEPAWLFSGLNRWMWNFVPQPAVTFFLDIPPEEAMLRKDDITAFEEVRGRAVYYHYLAQHASLVWIDGCADTGVIQTQVRQAVEPLLAKFDKETI